jgi:Arc/MetJ family transcription regulator
MYNMMQVIIMRTTINLSDDIIKETESLYNANTRSRAIENALKDAIRFKKLQLFMKLKSKIHFDEEAMRNLREKEINETENNS